MNSNRLFATFSVIILAGAGYALYQWVQPEDVSVVRSTSKKTGSPVSKLTMEKGTVRSAKNLHLSRKDDVGTEVEEKDLAKQSKPVAELDAKFATWRDDGRKAVEDMFGGDRDKINNAFRVAMANDEFRANYQRMRELESQYRSATDDQKQSIMDELGSVRSRGLGMLKQAAAGAPSTAAPTVTITGGGVVNPGNGAAPDAAPVPAPAPPIVFQ
ncbi:hypothetical protein EMGBS6_14230 [Opitutia bacterium]|nr:hypothetical protein EMGBS6_14230 [Opitutae bacterium]